jgi:hypothetical protein
MEDFTYEGDGGASRQDDPDTSHDAAQSIRVTHLEDVVLRALFDAGREGLTTFELVDVTGLSLVTVSPRLRPLVRKGRAYDSGQRRENPATGRRAIVWRSSFNKDAQSGQIASEVRCDASPFGL